MIVYDNKVRGFRRGKFLDAYGEECSIQKSSSAEDDHIWLGVHSPKPQMMARYAPPEWRTPGPEELNGWVDVPLPEGTSIASRMHLSREQVAELLPVLQHFVDTGDLP